MAVWQVFLITLVISYGLCNLAGVIEREQIVAECRADGYFEGLNGVVVFCGGVGE